MNRKNANSNTYKEKPSKGGEQFPAIQMNSVKNRFIRVSSLQRLQVAHIHLRNTSAPWNRKTETILMKPK